MPETASPGSGRSTNSNADSVGGKDPMPTPSDESAAPVGGARQSMFGLRWINATSLSWHARADCPVLKASRNRAGWTPYPITLGYGVETYKPCRRCTEKP